MVKSSSTVTMSVWASNDPSQAAMQCDCLEVCVQILFVLLVYFGIYITSLLYLLYITLVNGHSYTSHLGA